MWTLFCLDTTSQNKHSLQRLTDEEDEDEERAHLQGVGLGETLQLGPHLLEDVYHLLLHLHPGSGWARSGREGRPEGVSLDLGVVR